VIGQPPVALGVLKRHTSGRAEIALIDWERLSLADGRRDQSVGWGSMDSDSAKIGSGEIEMNDGTTSTEQRNIDMPVTPPHSSKEDSEFPFTGEFAKHDEQVKVPDVLRPRVTL
jgi:hypothetical protein